MHTFKVTEHSKYHGHPYWQHCFKLFLLGDDGHFHIMDFLVGSGVMRLAHASSAVTMHFKLCCACLTVYQMCTGVSCVYEVLWHPQSTNLSAVLLFRQCCAHYPAKHLTLEQSHLTVSVLSEKNTYMTHAVIYSSGCNCQDCCSLTCVLPLKALHCRTVLLDQHTS